MLNLLRTTLFGIILWVLAGCHDIDTASLKSFQGTWSEQGTGLLVTIHEESVKVYRHTRKTCLEILNFSEINKAEEHFARIKANRADKSFSFIPKNVSEFNRITLVKTELPEPCTNPASLKEFNPEFIFEHTWHAMNDYYPFFQLRGVDWQAQWDHFRPLVDENTTQEELFSILTKTLFPIDDGHVQLFANINDNTVSFSPGSNRGWNLLASIQFDDDNDSVDAYANTLNIFNQTLARNYGLEDFTSSNLISDTGVPFMHWGILEGNIGYLQINSMMVYKDGEQLEICEQINALHSEMNSVLADLGETQSMIVDIRFNTGGYDEFSLALAGYFAESKTKAFSKENYNLGNPTPRREYFIDPMFSKQYNKPVNLIIGPDTSSAAEIFTLAMKSLPQVHTTGQTTHGILSDVLSVELMEGWVLGMSYQTYYSTEETVYEHKGIYPDETVPVVSKIGTFEFGAFPAIAQAIENFDVDLSISQEVFTQRIEEIIADTNIPGFSAAWINDSRILGTFTSGFADMDTERRVSEMTPFGIASISKTLIGVSAMQMIEQSFIEIDTSFSDLNMSFSIDNPHTESNNITILDLATHTSGISDHENYGCAYYLESDLSSLNDDSDCPEPAETNQMEFIASFLDSSGQLYDEEQFTGSDPGEEYHYSNVGAALAAEMLSVASGTDYKTWTEENIINILNMGHTHWFHHEFEGIEPPATRYHSDEGEVIQLPEYALSTWSDGGLKTTPTDLSRYLLSIVQGGVLDGQRILTQESVDLMLSHLLKFPVHTGKQGMFWYGDEFMFGHDGGDPGTTAEMVYDQHNKMGLVFMFNLSIDDDDKFEKTLTDIKHLVYRYGLSLNQE
jgi:CubicO group peptidase (beta-lactamase class C family)